jgi:hypothetical protein
MTGRIIRPSQFILAYGVGSIIETDNGSRIVPSFKKWGKYFQNSYYQKEIEDANAINQLRSYHDKPRIFSISTNSDLKKKDSMDIYPLNVFPRWGICMMHTGDPILGKISPFGHFDCFVCKKENKPSHKVTGIQFVAVCNKGHLNDINWPHIVHINAKNHCNSTVFTWIGEGQSARAIKIKCQKCKQQIQLSQVYKIARDDKLECSGVYIETDDKLNKCDSKAKVLLRNGSNIRIPDIQVNISIPYRDSELYKILFSEIYYNALLPFFDNPITTAEICSYLRRVKKNQPKITEPDIKQIESFSDEELNQVLVQLLRDKNSGKVNEGSIRHDEFTALVHASIHGHPPEHSGSITKFEIEKRRVKKIEANETRWGISFTITPIKTLSVIIVQRGYRREVGDVNVNGDLVQTYFEDEEGNAWYPGVETIGEGIFIQIDSEQFTNNSGSWDQWMKVYKNPEKKNYAFHPLFVWLHSFSHRIISSLSIDAGYSSSSIRERIYIDINQEIPNKSQGGILLYTSQSGGDGTLGGLIAQTENFKIILNRSLNNIDSCSNDPLCSTIHINNNRENGAACYTCMLLSETTCEYRNKFLDRHLLKQRHGIR